MKQYEMKGKPYPLVVVIENRCYKFFDGKKMYTGDIAHRKYIAWLLDNDLANDITVYPCAFLGE